MKLKSSYFTFFISFVLFLSTISQPYAFSATLSSADKTIRICSFNVQFLGNSATRDNIALASILKDYDIVVIQELLSPPYAGKFPNGEPFKPNPKSAKFFDAMRNLGFQYILSEEDTGTGDKIHSNSSSTEWWVTFYKSNMVKQANDLPSGFLAEDRSNNNDYERVPYAFAFRTMDEKMDFVLISVHLQPDSSKADKARRKHELSSIASWIDNHDKKEKDFIILGDMNIENEAELKDATPVGFLSLNDECRQTNTNVNDPKPYDHVMYNIKYTSNEIDKDFDLKVIDLVAAMKNNWHNKSHYPGDPYNHDEFRKYYSDHDPVEFRMISPNADDD